MLRPHISPSKPDRMSQIGPEYRWTIFLYGTLELLYELRERARETAMPGVVVAGPGPEDTADALLDDINALGAQMNVHPPGLVGMVVDGVQGALYRHITVPGRWGSWAALQSAAQEAAEEVAATVAAVADEIVEARDDYQRTTRDQDAVETVTSMDRVVAMMRMVVAAVHAPGPAARG